ncbi:hypothetical protein ASZ90_004723 [hydrocarbon metagenome]|uniref:Uncharacterized protein n=1 Tax=hydrocarbon metagenome TaxID=938273 RepID=A0A0W8FXG8_9ZZZZ
MVKNLIFKKRCKGQLIFVISHFNHYLVNIFSGKGELSSVRFDSSTQAVAFAKFLCTGKNLNQLKLF